MGEDRRVALFSLFICLAVLLGGCAAETVDPGGIPGTGSLSGTVSASQPFQAARVYAENLDKRMIYMVFTGGGSYRAMNLLPGRYQIWAAKKGFESGAPQEIQIQAGDHLEADFTLAEVEAQSLTLGHSSARFGGRGMKFRWSPMTICILRVQVVSWPSEPVWFVMDRTFSPPTNGRRANGTPPSDG